MKNFLGDYLVNFFAPAREHFAKPKNDKMLERMDEILDGIKKKR